MGKVNSMNQEGFEKKIDELFNGEFTVIGTYEKNYKEVEIKHNVCGETDLYIPTKFYRSKKCKKCQVKEKISSATQFLNKVDELTGDEYSVIGNYKKSKNKIKMKHNICGFEWMVTPDNFLRRSSRCPDCNNNARLTTEQFKEKMRVVVGTEHIFHGEYVNARTKMLCTHTPCNKSWMVVPYSLVQGVTCPFCSESRGEKKVRLLLEKHNLNYEFQKSFKECRGKVALNFDFYVKSKNLCIEYDGIQHFEPVDFAGKGIDWAIEQLESLKIRDSIKNKFCRDKGINLVRLPYTMKESEIKETLKPFLR